MSVRSVTGDELLGRTWWDLLAERAAQDPTRVAFRFGGPGWDDELTFGAWSALATAVARSLAELGVRRGDRVALLSPGSAVWPVMQAACSRLGAVLVPLNSRYRQDELSYLLARTAPTVLCAIDRLGPADVDARLSQALGSVPGLDPVQIRFPAPQVPTVAGSAAPGALRGRRRLGWRELIAPPVDALAVPPASLATDPVLLQFTSGTTAFPKGALLSSASTLRATYELGRRMGLTADDVMYSTQPMYHVGGSVATTLMALTIGCTMIVPERYTAEETFRLVQQHHATARTGQAAMYARELAHPDFSAGIFRTVTKGWSGGSPELKRAIVERMGIPDLISTYGLTEAAATTTACAADDPLEARLATSGRILPGLDLAVDDGGRMAPWGTGEICVRGWSLMLGYDDDPGATSAAVDAHGWLHTGDLGQLDDQGYLVVVDRIKEMIKPGGENVAPAEVERVIAQMPGVVEVAVVGGPDERLGEVPVAFVEVAATSGLSQRDVIDYCADRMASFKVPRDVQLITVWPMTGSGKVSKAELRARAGAAGLGWIGRTG
ncbi:MAG TPA: class I adenylate-forming enzyme family protein [Cellulomonas sp.]